MRLKKPLHLYRYKKSKKLSPKTQNFSKKLRAAKKQLSKEEMFGYFLRDKRKADNLPTATSSTGRA